MNYLFLFIASRMFEMYISGSYNNNSFFRQLKVELYIKYIVCNIDNTVELFYKYM